MSSRPGGELSDGGGLAGAVHSHNQAHAYPPVGQKVGCCSYPGSDLILKQLPERFGIGKASPRRLGLEGTDYRGRRFDPGIGSDQDLLYLLPERIIDAPPLKSLSKLVP